MRFVEELKVVTFIVQAVVTTLYPVNMLEMPTNIEIKAILKNRSYALEVAKKLNQSGGIVSFIISKFIIILI